MAHRAISPVAPTTELVFPGRQCVCVLFMSRCRSFRIDREDTLANDDRTQQRAIGCRFSVPLPPIRGRTRVRPDDDKTYFRRGHAEEIRNPGGFADDPVAFDENGCQFSSESAADRVERRRATRKRSTLIGVAPLRAISTVVDRGPHAVPRRFLGRICITRLTATATRRTGALIARLPKTSNRRPSPTGPGKDAGKKNNTYIFFKKNTQQGHSIRRQSYVDF